jgi:hypothetical protein
LDGASGVTYNNSTSGLTSITVQDAIDELKNDLENFLSTGTTINNTPPSNPSPGDLYDNTTDNHIYQWNGTIWVDQGAPNPGDMFYATSTSLTYQYDSSRNKWLSVTQMFLDWGSENADGKYLNIHGAAATQTGYLMPRDGTIIAVTAKCASGNMSKQLEIRKNNVGATPLKTLNLSGGTWSSTNDNIDFDVLDYIQAFAVSGGTPARDVVVMIIIAWR